MLQITNKDGDEGNKSAPETTREVGGELRENRVTRARESFKDSSLKRTRIQYIRTEESPGRVTSDLRWSIFLGGQKPDCGRGRSE